MGVIKVLEDLNLLLESYDVFYLVFLDYFASSFLFSLPVFAPLDFPEASFAQVIFIKLIYISYEAVVFLDHGGLSDQYIFHIAFSRSCASTCEVTGNVTFKFQFWRRSILSWSIDHFYQVLSYI